MVKKPGASSIYNGKPYCFVYSNKTKVHEESLFFKSRGVEVVSIIIIIVVDGYRMMNEDTGS